MDRQWCFLVAALLACLALASATDEKLSCFFGEKICNQWKDNENASFGSYNDLKFCCPPEPGQRLSLTWVSGSPPNKDTCKCKEGTAADWAHISTPSPDGTGDDDGNDASTITPPCLLAVVMLMAVGVLLF